METEIWKKHPEIEKLEVSSFGRVRTLDRVVPNGKHTQFVKGRILKQHVSKSKSYPYVGFRIDGKMVTKSVHRLVAQTFLPNPNYLPMVNHKDCDRTNNNVENLEFCTASYNQQYREKYGISRAESQNKPVFAINLTTLEVSHFRSQREAGRELGIFCPHINAVLKGRYKYTHGYWFTNADENAADAIKNKLHKIRKGD